MCAYSNASTKSLYYLSTLYTFFGVGVGYFFFTPMYILQKNTYNKRKKVGGKMKRIHHQYMDYSKEELGEDATKFGEFVCSCYKWLPLDEQKENAKELAKLTKRKFH